MFFPLPWPAWTVAPALRRASRPDGLWMLYDESRGLTWQVSSETLALLDAVAEGWTPSLPLPDGLAAAVAPDLLGEADWCVLIAGLVQEGLVSISGDPNVALPTDGSFQSALTAGLLWNWRDIRLPLFRVPPIPPRFARAVTWASGLLVVLAFASVGWVIQWTAAGASSPLRFAWDAARAGLGGWQSVALLVLAIAVLTLVHEVGHAVVFGAATARSTPIGLRVFWGIPQAYADIRALPLIADLRTRLAILLAGVAAETLVWVPCAWWALRSPGTAPPLVLILALFAAPWALTFNLLLPWYWNDGYFLLIEWSGIVNLAGHAKRAAMDHLLRPVAAAPRPLRWWLPWYGLLHLGLAPAGIAMLGGIVGVATHRPAVGGLLGVALGGWALVSNYRAACASPPSP